MSSTINYIRTTKALSVQMKNADTIDVIYFNNSIISEEDVYGYIAALDFFYKEKKLKSIIELEDDVEIDILARKLLINEKKLRRDSIIAEAIVVKNFSQKLLAEHYEIVNGKYYPIKVFTNRINAELWIESFED